MQRLRPLAGIVAGFMFCTVALGAPPSHARVAFNIPQQRLSDALAEWSRQSGLQVLQRDSVAGAGGEPQSLPVTGQYSPEEALTVLLSGSGLKHEFVNDTTVRVARVKASQEAPTERNATKTRASSSTQSAEGAKPTSVAPVNGASGGERAGHTADATNVESQNEIVVTAQRRKEILLDVPQSISVLNPDELTSSGASRLQDWVGFAPGVTLTSSGGPGRGSISMRGLNTGSDASVTVATYIDDVSYGSASTNTNSTRYMFDPSLMDWERIEILRGPQGTLYGASAIGGLIKYVSKAPDLSNFEGQVRVGLGSVTEGGINRNGSISFNVPLVSDRVALRGNVFGQRDSGFVDNVAAGFAKKDVGTADVAGGRLDLAIAATDNLSIRLSAFAQDIDRDGAHDSAIERDGRPTFGSLLRVESFSSESGFEQEVRVYSATATYDFSGAQLTSISAYQDAQTAELVDVTRFLGDLVASVIGVPIAQAQLGILGGAEKFTQEFRLASTGSGPFDWVVGAFYADEDGLAGEYLDAVDASGNPISRSVLTDNKKVSTYEEIAGFANVTYRITDKFDVSGGLRYSTIDQDARVTDPGVLGVSQSPASSSENVLTYLANARYQFSPNATGYVRFATGFRPGGPNFRQTDAATGVPYGPATFGADEVRTYEVGLRAQTDDARFGGDVALYYMDWEDIQVNFVESLLRDYRTNASGGATSQGIELAGFARPTERWTVRGTFTYMDPTLNEDTPELLARKGERLPFTPEYQGSLATEYVLDVAGVDLTAGLAAKYIGDRKTGLSGQNPFMISGFTTLDVTLGAEIGSYAANLYVANATDEREVVHSNNIGQAVVLRPRTVGLSVSRSF